MRNQDRGSGIEDCQRAARRWATSSQSSIGFTLLELIAVISIVAILAGLFLSRVPYYQELAEKTAMEQVAASVQSALVLRYSSLMARGAADDKELAKLSTDNPMSWLQSKPRNYAGEFFDPGEQAAAPGHWIFDLKSHDLIYLVDHADYFRPGSDGRKWIRFHVQVIAEPALGRPNSKEVTSTLFQPVAPYHWLD